MCIVRFYKNENIKSTFTEEPEVRQWSRIRVRLDIAKTMVPRSQPVGGFVFYLFYYFFFLLMVTSASEIFLLNTFYKERRKKLSSDGD